MQVPYGSPSLVARTFIKVNQRVIARKLNLDLLLEQLPQIKLENEITHKQKEHIEKILKYFWTKSNFILLFSSIKFLFKKSIF